MLPVIILHGALTFTTTFMQIVLETVCMKCQIFFSGKKSDKYFGMSCWKFYTEC